MREKRILLLFCIIIFCIFRGNYTSEPKMVSFSCPPHLFFFTSTYFYEVVRGLRLLLTEIARQMMSRYVLSVPSHHWRWTCIGSPPLTLDKKPTGNEGNMRRDKMMRVYEGTLALLAFTLPCIALARVHCWHNIRK